MNLGREKNGLAGPSLHPWHIRGTYRSYGKHGKAEYEGTYEEWWFSPTKYRRTFSGLHLTQTDYGMGTAILREGTQEWPTGAEILLRESLIDPLPGPQVLGEFGLKRSAMKVGKADMDCVSLTYRIPGIFPALRNVFPTACFEQEQPILREFSIGNSSDAVYDNVTQFEGHYLARELQIYRSRKLLADMTIDLIEPLDEQPDAILVPPRNASPVNLTEITMTGKSTEWPPVFMKVAPVYPDVAKPLRIQGTVDLEATIDMDGHVSGVQVIDGPPALQRASADAVAKWIYRPFEVMGAPHPVRVVLHVIFSLG